MTTKETPFELDLKAINKVNDSLTKPLFKFNTENQTFEYTDKNYFDTFCQQVASGEIFEKAKNGYPIAL